MDMNVPIITLLTDFGLEDTYVASMKGVILGISPPSRLVDISHLVPPQDVRAGAFLLASVFRSFPAGTIHLVVVDPGVGTDRLGLVIKTNEYFFVGPDNGLFSWVLREERGWEAYSLEHPGYRLSSVSSTFHGRDIFAPAAAHLAKGVPAEAMGPRCTPHSGSWAEPIIRDEEVLGEIIHIDHFGNAVTNVSREMIEPFAPLPCLRVRVGDLTIPRIVTTYGDQGKGETVALIGSTNHLEIAVNQGNAAKSLSLCRGVPVSIERQDRRG